MPLVGYICCQTGQPRDFDDCMADNRAGLCQHSLPLLSAMKMNADRRAGIGISSSVLNMCPRQHILEESTDYYEAPQDFYNRWRGSFGHYAIEMGGPYAGVVQEVRFYRSLDVDGELFTISGQPDWIDVARGHVSDAKFVARSPKAPYQDHENQVNVYVWLIEGGWTLQGGGPPRHLFPTGFEVETAEVNYMDTKGENIFPLTLWTTEAREGFIRRKLSPYKTYNEDGDLSKLTVVGTTESWKAKFCPFRREKNGGQCCMANAPVRQRKAPVRDYSIDTGEDPTTPIR